MINNKHDDNPNVSTTFSEKKVLSLLIVFLTALPFSVQGYANTHSKVQPLPFLDNASVRIMKYDEITTAISDLAYTRNDYFLIGSEDGRVKYSTETQNEYLYLLFTNERNGNFPLYSAGSYIIKRSLDNGRFIQIKIFYKSDPSFFVRIFPNRDRALMDVFMFGEPVYKGINLPLGFTNYLTASLSEIMQVTYPIVDWDMLIPLEQQKSYDDVNSMVHIIRQEIEAIPDADDGALDADGNWVSIESGEKIEPGGMNCSGFAKWVIDGLYGPVKGKYLEIEALKNRLTEIRGNRWSDRWEYERDPFFGLDWTRNLAGSLAEANLSFWPDYEAGDVTSSVLRDYKEDIGYAVEDLSFVLYEQAVKNPGYFYLGSVNGIFGDDPPLRQHYHIVLFFPVLSPEGSFRVAVFERGKETSFKNFKERYDKEFVHLVKVMASADFEPPDIQFSGQR